MQKRACRAALATSVVEEAANAFALALPLCLALAAAFAAALSLRLLGLLGRLDHLAIMRVRARVARLALRAITDLEARKGLLVGDCGQGDSLLRAGLREELT